MDRFIAKIKQETNGEIEGDLEVIRIPLDLYRARNSTSREWNRTRTSDHPFARSPVFLVGDSAMGRLRVAGAPVSSPWLSAGVASRRDPRAAPAR